MTEYTFICMTCRKRTAKLETTKNGLMEYIELKDGICDRYWYLCTKCPDYESTNMSGNIKEEGQHSICRGAEGLVCAPVLSNDEEEKE